jgi:hypothetical protein
MPLASLVIHGYEERVLVSPFRLTIYIFFQIDSVQVMDPQGQPVGEIGYIRNYST